MSSQLVWSKMSSTMLNIICQATGHRRVNTPASWFVLSYQRHRDDLGCVSRVSTLLHLNRLTSLGTQVMRLWQHASFPRVLIQGTFMLYKFEKWLWPSDQLFLVFICFLCFHMFLWLKQSLYIYIYIYMGSTVQLTAVTMTMCDTVCFLSCIFSWKSQQMPFCTGLRDPWRVGVLLNWIWESAGT